MSDGDETHLSTEQREAESDPWVPGTHGHPRRAAGPQAAARQRAQAAGAVGINGGRRALQADQTFPRRARLLQRSDYDRVLRQPQWRGGNAYFRCSAARNHRGEPRLGLAIPKRVVRRATARNRLKRVIRESFRQRKATLPDADFVIGVRSAATLAQNVDLYPALDELWAQARDRLCGGSSLD